MLSERAPAHRRQPYMLAITGGKGGIGKSHISINLAFSLARMEQKVLLIDADLQLANLDILLGLKPSYRIHDLIEGRCALEEVVTHPCPGVDVLHAQAGHRPTLDLEELHLHALMQALQPQMRSYDFIIIDTASGLGPHVMSFLRMVDEVAVVLCDDPASLADAYVQIKWLQKEQKRHRFSVICNRMASDEDGARLYRRLYQTAEHFLDVMLRHRGTVYEDTHVGQALRHHRALVDLYPQARSTSSFRSLAHAFLNSHKEQSFAFSPLSLSSPMISPLN